MKTILAMCPNESDATSYYRGVGPLWAMKKAGMANVVLTAPTTQWPILTGGDILFMQRPYSRTHFEMAVGAKSYGIPLWVDYDDNMLAVPVDNPAHSVFNTPDTQKNIQTILAIADVVTVSTRELANTFLGFRVNSNKSECVVIPNAVDDSAPWYRKRLDGKIETRKNTILWRGSNTHQKDLMTYADKILMVNTDKHEWNFIGYNPFFLTEKLTNVSYYPGGDISAYHHTIQKLAPEIMIVPLFDNALNRSKSNIAWLEGTLAGAACLVPDWDEWKKPGAIRYDEENNSFFNQLSRMIEDPSDFAVYNQKSFEYIKNHLVLSKVNELRKSVLDEIS